MTVAEQHAHALAIARHLIRRGVHITTETGDDK